jgi:hypothetical protein
LLTVGEEYAPRPFRTGFLLGGFKHSDWEMPGKVNSENDMLEMHHIGITKFHSSTAFFSVVMKIKIVRKLLSKLQRNTRRQKIGN